MAVGLIIMLPVIIFYFLGQRYFIEGVTLTGLKG
jgi:multiple sugar transport system permease protein